MSYFEVALKTSQRREIGIRMMIIGIWIQKMGVQRKIGVRREVGMR